MSSPGRRKRIARCAHRNRRCAGTRHPGRLTAFFDLTASMRGEHRWHALWPMRSGHAAPARRRVPRPTATPPSRAVPPRSKTPLPRAKSSSTLSHVRHVPSRACRATCRNRISSRELARTLSRPHRRAEPGDQWLSSRRPREDPLEAAARDALIAAGQAGRSPACDRPQGHLRTDGWLTTAARKCCPTSSRLRRAREPRSRPPACRAWQDHMDEFAWDQATESRSTAR